MKYQFPILRVLTLVAIAVSTALLADHLSGTGPFCGFEGPCEELAASEYGELFGVPLSAMGIGWFAFFYVLTLIAGRWARGGLRVLAVATGLGGLALLVIQFAVLHKFCPLCLVVDFAALALAAITLARRPAMESLRWYWVAGWAWLGLAAILVPTFFAIVSQTPPVPDQVREHWEPGRVTVVEVTDFDCIYCARADAVFKPVLRQHDVKFVRLVAPMRGHPNARPAGRAYLAAVRQGKGEEMAALLYAAESRDAATCRKLAVRLGLDLAAYDRVIEDPAIDAEMEATTEWAARKSRTGLPLIWVQDQLLTGVPSSERIEEAFARARPPKE